MTDLKVHLTFTLLKGDRVLSFGVSNLARQAFGEAFVKFLEALPPETPITAVHETTDENNVKTDLTVVVRGLRFNQADLSPLESLAAWMMWTK